MTLHYNFTAFNEFEVFSSDDEIREYREFKLKEVQKSVSFVRNLFNKKLNVLEIGSGNSKFLYALEKNGLLQQGYGIDVSSTRVEFADNWKRELQIENVSNINENILKSDLNRFPQLDLVYCVDLAFHLFDPAEKNSDIDLLNKCYKKLKNNGKIILELDSYDEILKSMQNNKVKLWQEFDKSDPWVYLLWDCEYEEEKSFLNIKKTFIKRDLSETSKSDISLRVYSKSDIITLLESASFDKVQIFQNWENESDMPENKFLIVGEKN